MLAANWTPELIELAGGEDIFANLAKQSLAKQRIIADPRDVVRKDPEIIIGSWCGKPFSKVNALPIFLLKLFSQSNKLNALQLQAFIK